MKIVSLKDKKSDFVFWSSRSYQERLETIELLRQQYISFNKDAQQGFQRVCRIVSLKKLPMLFISILNLSLIF